MDITRMKTVEAQLTEMKRIADNAEFWMGLSGKNEAMKARNFMERLDMLSSLCVKGASSQYDFNDNMRLNKSMMKFEVAKLVQKRGRANKLAADSESAVLNDVSELTADWEDDDTRVIQDSEEPNADMQRLLRNLNAHNIALIIIGQKNLDDVESAGAYLRVLEKAYIFLLKFVRNNPENQQLLIEHLDEFIDDAGHGVHAVELVIEIFRHN